MPNQRVNIYRPEWYFACEAQSPHHHTRVPKEYDVEAGYQYVCRVVALELRRFVGPTQSREWPECRGEPGVEHVFVASYWHGVEVRSRLPGRNNVDPPWYDGYGLLVVLLCLRDRFFLGMRNKNMSLV